MVLADLTEWMAEFTGTHFIWYIKRLSGNDTLANQSHQAGPYIPKTFLFDLFPQLNHPDIENPRVEFDVHIDSHADSRRVTAIWYNNKLRGGTRNEARLTNFGGRSSALLDPESTGSLAVFIFALDSQNIAQECHVWVCRDETEEDLVENRLGPVEPGQWKIWSVDAAVQLDLFPTQKKIQKPCSLTLDTMPPSWLLKFPSGLEIIQKTLALRPDNHIPPDKRLMERRKCEFEIFLSLEEAIEMPRIKQGFDTINEFIAYAQTLLQRRKARSGRSLELHAREIFLEEGLIEGLNFSHQAESEAGQRPDFLFPSQAAYQDANFPDDRLHMLAVKTTCKDRWRQILREADRIPNKHLLTLQEGVSENQFAEMTHSGVQLVVPKPLIGLYPTRVQPHLKTLEDFIADMRLLSD